MLAALKNAHERKNGVSSTPNKGASNKHFKTASNNSRIAAVRVIAKTSLVKNLLERALNSSFLFRSLKSPVIQQIISSMFEVKVHGGHAIINEGEEGDNFYVVTSGKLECLKDINGQTVKLVEYGPGTCFGELALLYNCARAASVVAMVDSTVWALDRESFNTTVVYHSEETRAAQLLRSSAFFSPLNEHMLTELIHQTERRAFKGAKCTADGDMTGALVLKKGQRCKALHVVMEGEVTVRHVVSKSVVDRKLGPGQVFGMVETLKDQPVDANIYATSKTTVILILPREYLISLEKHLNRQMSSSTLVQYLARSPLTKALNQEGLESLCPLFVKVKYQPGTHPFKHGMTREICVLDDGEVSLPGSSKNVIRTPGHIFGEDVLRGQYKVPNVTIGKEGAYMYVLKEEKLEEATSQIEKSKMLATLKTVKLFESLSRSELEALADAMKAYNFKKGEVLIQQGDHGDKFYILFFGELVVLKRENDGAPYQEMMRFKEGCFGERALIENKPRAATVQAVTKGRVYVIGKEAFEEHLGSLSDLMQIHTKEVERKQMNKLIKFTDLTALRTIGVGSFGRVRLVYHKQSNGVFALKSLSKRLIVQYKQEAHLRNERVLMGQVTHPFCSRLIKSFKDNSHVHLLMEFSQGGELFHLLDSHLKDDVLLEESYAKFYAACVILVLEHLHTKGIIYRDLKPENLVLDKDGYIKVTDFGFAKEVDGYTYTVCGTPDYMAPEIITRQGHNRAVDYWALGVLVYEMLFGGPPFGTQHDSEQQVYQNILDCNYNAVQEDVSPEAMDLIGKLLVVDPNRRLGMSRKGIRDIKEHPWFAEIDFIRLERKKIAPPFTPQVTDAFDTSHFDRYDESDEGGEGALYQTGTWDDCF